MSSIINLEIFFFILVCYLFLVGVIISERTFGGKYRINMVRLMST